MNCREYEELWNDWLDARCEPLGRLEVALDAHASACPQCQATTNRYQLLRQAISGIRPPTPSAEATERLRALMVPAPIPIAPCRRWTRLRKPLAAAAAAACVLAWLGASLYWPASEPLEGPAPRLVATPGPKRPLGLALAEATRATLDLAREASAPASRIGREVLDLGQLSASGLDVAPEPLAEPESLAEPEPPPGLLRAVGERVGAGVKPLSGSARHAFGFLLGAPDEPDAVPVPTGRDGL